MLNSWQFWRNVVNDHRHRLPLALLKLFDLVLVLSSFGLTTVLVVHNERRISVAQFLSMRTKVSNCAIFLLALFLSHIVFSVCGLYQSRRLSTKLAEAADVLKATTLVVICFIAVGSIFHIRMITIPFLGLFWIVSSLVLCPARLMLRYVLAYVRSQGKNLRHMLVLGTNPRAVDFAQRITAKYFYAPANTLIT